MSTFHLQQKEGWGADLSCSSCNCSIVEEAEAHDIVALSMMPGRPHYGYPSGSFMPAPHVQSGLVIINWRTGVLLVSSHPISMPGLAKRSCELTWWG